MVVLVPSWKPSKSSHEVTALFRGPVLMRSDSTHIDARSTVLVSTSGLGNQPPNVQFDAAALRLALGA
jgi:hypothetical protein